MLKNRSGQYVYFSLISALSGNAVAGASGSVSGRKCLDGLSGMITLSGNVIELGGGAYRANLYDFDTNGDQAGYYFTASGCVPVLLNYDMIDGNGSGRFYPASGMTFPASGAFATVSPASLSGVTIQSGAYSTVLPANLSGVFATVLPANLSGVVANSGLFVTATATVDPAAISGVFATVPKATLSGVVVQSGAYATVLLANLSGVVANSGLSVSVLPANLSGLVASVLPDTLSGVTVNVLSGTTYLNSGFAASVLTHPFTGMDYSGQRNLLNAARKLINRFDLAAFSGRLAVYREDDSTLAYLQDVTTQSGAVPITALKGN